MKVDCFGIPRRGLERHVAYMETDEREKLRKDIVTAVQVLCTRADVVVEDVLLVTGPDGQKKFEILRSVTVRVVVVFDGHKYWLNYTPHEQPGCALAFSDADDYYRQYGETHLVKDICRKFDLKVPFGASDEYYFAHDRVNEAVYAAAKKAYEPHAWILRDRKQAKPDDRRFFISIPKGSTPKDVMEIIEDDLGGVQCL